LRTVDVTAGFVERICNLAVVVGLTVDCEKSGVAVWDIKVCNGREVARIWIVLIRSLRSDICY
jgi:hypothetical protein